MAAGAASQNARRSSRHFTEPSSSAPTKTRSKRASGGRSRRTAAETDDEDAEDHDEGDLEDSEEEQVASRPVKRRGKAKTRDRDYDSDALDEDSDFDASEEEDKKSKTAKRKRENGPGKARKTSSPRKRRRKLDEEEDDDDVELKEGQEVVGVVVQAPKSGRVPPGQVSQNTLDFLQKLADPKCNDREWFKLHEPVYRLAEKEFKDFIEEFTETLSEVDPHVPILPPKDVIHRIYRDIRFSNDKTPYKRNFCASLSRSGRKGIFACYSFSVQPGGQSLLAAGTWCPGKNELATIRSNIARSSDRLRQIISDPEFVNAFGEPKPMKNGGRSSIFGRDDELKVAPKGFDKDHKDIDLLKLRTFAVIHYFKDSDVLDPNFKTKLGEIAAVARPFVRCMNDLMTLQDQGDDGNEE
ncbi:hypothetical protein GYMLUDRAFT_43495 [Collybiopsis luxurians FD-317 M1]|uniref:TIGR02453 family protein n=1 Tax=Collybiopsis luxurians FD-317 M1 TaxID=944289 RepID=A0A0D0CEJ6_9AGAR|nr:hypothetical protein GYMLUDRAFT_43495 [Collybiopsis luxurians FD-317 M1]